MFCGFHPKFDDRGKKAERLPVEELNWNKVINKLYQKVARKCWFPIQNSKPYFARRAFRKGFAAWFRKIICATEF